MASKIISLWKGFQRLLVGPQHGTKFSFTPNHLVRPANFNKTLLSSQLSHKVLHNNLTKTQVLNKFSSINVVRITSSKSPSDNKYFSWENNKSPFIQQFYSLYHLDKVLYKERSLLSLLTSSHLIKYFQEPYIKFTQYCDSIFKKTMTLLITPPSYVRSLTNQSLEKSSALKLYKIREAIFPIEKSVSPSNYFLSAPLNQIYLHHLSLVLSHDFFTEGYKPTFLKIVPTSEFKVAFSNLIARLEGFNCALKDISILLLRLLEFGPWRASVTNSEFKIWFPSSFNFYTSRQFIRDIGMEPLLTRLTLGTEPYSSYSERELLSQVAERHIAPQKFTPQGEQTPSYRQELFDFMNLIEISRGGLSLERN